MIIYRLFLILQKYSRWDVNFDISVFQIMVFENFLDQIFNMMVLDFGYVYFYNKTMDVSGKSQIDDDDNDGEL